MKKLIEKAVAESINDILNGNDGDKKEADSSFSGDRFFPDGTLVMIFLDKGFIYVGRLYQDSEEIMRLEDSRNCRSQSTGKGWGYVAKTGPRECTLDDYTGTPIKFTKDSICLIKEVEEDIWTDND